LADSSTSSVRCVHVCCCTIASSNLRLCLETRMDGVCAALRCAALDRTPTRRTRRLVLCVGGSGFPVVQWKLSAARHVMASLSIILHVMSTDVGVGLKRPTVSRLRPRVPTASLPNSIIHAQNRRRAPSSRLQHAPITCKVCDYVITRTLIGRPAHVSTAAGFQRSVRAESLLGQPASAGSDSRWMTP